MIKSSTLSVSCFKESLTYQRALDAHTFNPDGLLDECQHAIMIMNVLHIVEDEVCLRIYSLLADNGASGSSMNFEIFKLLGMSADKEKQFCHYSEMFSVKARKSHLNYINTRLNSMIRLP